MKPSASTAARGQAEAHASAGSSAPIIATPGTTIKVLNGTHRGAGDTRWSWLFTISGYLLVRVHLTCTSISPPEAGGGSLLLKGTWLVMAADLYVRVSLNTARFRHSGWLRARA